MQGDGTLIFTLSQSSPKNNPRLQILVINIHVVILKVSSVVSIHTFQTMFSSLTSTFIDQGLIKIGVQNINIDPLSHLAKIELSVATNMHNLVHCA